MKLETIQDFINNIKEPQKETIISPNGYEWKVWKKGYSLNRFKREIIQARAMLLDLLKEYGG